MTIESLNWTEQDTRHLRGVVAWATHHGEHYVRVKGKTVTLEYARHRLACLNEIHPDTASERENSHVRQ